MPNEIENVEQSHIIFDKIDKEYALVFGLIIVVVIYIILKLVF